MACERDTRKISLAGAGSGVAALSSRLGYVTGAIARRATEVDQAIERTGQTVAPAAQVVLAATDNLQSQPAARRAINGTMLAASLLVPPVRTARRLLKRIEQVSSMAGDLAGTISKTEPAGEVWGEKRSLFFFKARIPVTLWRSRLTDALNRQDLPGTRRFSGRDIVSSEGVMFRAGNKTWHCGTAVAKTSQGQRTITHLQSLSLPNNHYYFNQPLSDRDAVGIASGQTDPKTITGYVGQVSSGEALCPIWSDTKHALIKTQLYWPGQTNPRKG